MNTAKTKEPGVPEVSCRRITDRRCPHCDAFKAMPNPVEHTRAEGKPYLCLQCHRSFAQTCTEN